jgi:16S rRNA (adenine1518-N6/adenine1519-N6)-dimethyltransferase
VSDATIMIQKEVALRITAKPGNPEYGILSVFSGYFAETKLLFDVAPTAFFPKPKIVSSVLRLRMRDHPVRQAADESFFRAMVRSTFGKRRKTLRNSLGYFAAEKGFLLPAIPGLSRRPEELSIDELVALSDALCACRGNIGGERLA